MTDTASPATVPLAAPQVQFLTDKPRVAAVTLDWPLAVDSAEYRVIYVKRMTTR